MVLVWLVLLYTIADVGGDVGIGGISDIGDVSFFLCFGGLYVRSVDVNVGGVHYGGVDVGVDGGAVVGGVSIW